MKLRPEPGRETQESSVCEIVEAAPEVRGLASRRAYARVMDICGALFALVIFAPVFALAAALIVWDDGPPIFFRQRRVGQNGRTFEIFKLRTMRAGDGGPITVGGDERITRVGGWLRKRKLDELPQFLNVLRGDMSLIGSRPEVPQYVAMTSWEWQTVLSARPGITDLATLMFRNEEEILSSAADPYEYYRGAVLPVKLRLNMQYQQSRTFVRDLKLLWMTAWYSLFPRQFEAGRIAETFGVTLGDLERKPESTIHA